MTLFHDGVRIDPHSVHHGSLGALLASHGWLTVGGRPEFYVRLMREGATGPALILPTDERMADYGDLIEDLVGVLATEAQRGEAAARAVLDRLILPPGDTVRFRKEVESNDGAVPWLVGERLIQSARGMLLAGAKARLSARPYYGQANGIFANRFLGSVLMGQTEVGSYVVTAVTPPDEVFPEKKTTEAVLPGIASYTGRDILSKLVQGLGATHEALEHYHESRSLEGFEAVERGVSRELTDAVMKLAQDNGESTVSVEFAPRVGLIGGESTAPETVSFRYEPRDAPVLEKASARLAALAPTEYITASGWLSVVARPRRGEAGIVRMRVAAGSEARTLQVRLSESDFEVAADAIAHELPIRMSGRQEKEGNRYWLYDVRDVEVLMQERQPPPPDTLPL